MINFKSYLTEYLTDEQRERYKDVHMTDKARSDTDHFFGVGNDKVHGEIKHDDKSEIHKQLETHLGRDLSHDEYKSGLTTDKYGRSVKLGRLIKDNDLRNQFDKDPSRKISMQTAKTSTVRGIEVAGQTNSAKTSEHPTGHSWHDASCKNVDTGINKHYLSDEIKHGTVVHRVHDHNGQEIYRATLHPHHNDSGDVAYALDAEYGIKHPAFTADAHRVASKLSGEHGSGVYKKSRDVYDDSGVDIILHPAATSSDLLHVVKTAPPEEVRRLMNHPHMKGEALNAALHHGDYQVRRQAMIHPNLSHTQIDKLIGSDDRDIKISIASNPNLTAEHISKLQKDSNWNVRQRVLGAMAVNEHHLTTALKDEDSDVRYTAAGHPKANEQHLTTAIYDKDPFVRNAAFANPNVSDGNIRKWLDHPDPDIRTRAASHYKASDATLMHAVTHEDAGVRRAALSNQNLQPHHLDHLLRDPDTATKAARHIHLSDEQIHKILDAGRDAEKVALFSRIRPGNLSTSHVDKGMEDPNPKVREAAVRSSLAKPHHILKALNDPDVSVAHAAVDGFGLHYDKTIAKAIRHPDAEVRNAALNIPEIEPKHIKYVMKNDPSEENRRKAERLLRTFKYQKVEL